MVLVRRQAGGAGWRLFRAAASELLGLWLFERPPAPLPPRATRYTGKYVRPVSLPTSRSKLRRTRRNGRRAAGLHLPLRGHEHSRHPDLFLVFHVEHRIPALLPSARLP